MEEGTGKGEGMEGGTGGREEGRRQLERGVGGREKGRELERRVGGREKGRRAHRVW